MNATRADNSHQIIGGRALKPLQLLKLSAQLPSRLIHALQGSEISLNVSINPPRRLLIILPGFWNAMKKTVT